MTGAVVEKGEAAIPQKIRRVTRVVQQHEIWIAVAVQVAHFVSADENVTPYGVTGHRHSPEIGVQLAVLGAHGDLEFVPHLLPLDQGELVSCYVKPSRRIGADEVALLYAAAYGDEAFVELTDRAPGVRDVRETNICRIHVHITGGGRILVFSVIDNLWKGASSQAVQNLNVMFGLPEDAGLGPTARASEAVV